MRQLQSVEGHIADASAAIDAALAELNALESEMFCAAALDARLSLYGAFCARKALLQRISVDLAILSQT